MISLLQGKPHGLKASQLIVGWLGLAVLLSLLFAGNLGAKSASLSQGYRTDETLVPGTMVSLDNKKPKYVAPSSVQNAEALTGVVVASNDSLLSLSSDNNQAQVASSGEALVFVTSMNGDINVGDKIAPSTIAGVGMKATESGVIVGVAQAEFKASSSGAEKRTVKDKSGASKEAYIGQIPVQIYVTTFVAGTGDTKSVIPAALQDLTNQIAGKNVSPVRVVVSLLILLVALISVTTLLYSAVRNSIISIGRNPLSQAAVYRSLIQVFIIVVAVLLVAMGSLYLILTK